MVKKMPIAARAAPSTAKTDVVTRVTAEAIEHAYNLFHEHGSEHEDDVADRLVAEAELLKGNNRRNVSPFAGTHPARR